MCDRRLSYLDLGGGNGAVSVLYVSASRTSCVHSDTIRAITAVAAKPDRAASWSILKRLSSGVFAFVFNVES